MNKAFVTVSLTPLFWLIFAHSQAQETLTPSWQAKGFVGTQRADTLGWNGGRYATNNGDLFGVGFSKRLTPRTSVGFELSRTKSKYTLNDAYISGTAAMLTAEYDFFYTSRYSVYGGLGLGLVRPTFELSGIGEVSETVKGSQATLGARYTVSPSTKLFIEARYIDTADHFSISGIGSLPSNATAEYNANGIVLGINYSF